MKTLEELAAEYIVADEAYIHSSDPPGVGSHYLRSREIFTEMITRFGFEETEPAIKNARKTYRLLTPET